MAAPPANSSSNNLNVLIASEKEMDAGWPPAVISLAPCGCESLKWVQEAGQLLYTGLSFPCFSLGTWHRFLFAVLFFTCHAHLSQFLVEITKWVVNSGCVSVHGELWQDPNTARDHHQPGWTELHSDWRAVCPQGEMLFIIQKGAAQSRFLQ